MSEIHNTYCIFSRIVILYLVVAQRTSGIRTGYGSSRKGFWIYRNFEGMAKPESGFFRAFFLTGQWSPEAAFYKRYSDGGSG